MIRKAEKFRPRRGRRVSACTTARGENRLPRRSAPSGWKMSERLAGCGSKVCSMSRPLWKTASSRPGERERESSRDKSSGWPGCDLFGGKAIKELIESAGKFLFRERGQRQGKVRFDALWINWIGDFLSFFLNRSVRNGFELVPVEYLCTAVVKILSLVQQCDRQVAWLIIDFCSANSYEQNSAILSGYSFPRV